MGRKTRKWDKNGNKVDQSAKVGQTFEQSGPKSPTKMRTKWNQSGKKRNQVGSKWEEEAKSGTRMRTKWGGVGVENESASGTSMRTKWDQSAKGEEAKSGTRTGTKRDQSGKRTQKWDKEGNKATRRI